MSGRVVIVGAGQGGTQAAASLRSEGWDGEIVLIGEEGGLPYQRPPLSKDFLAGKAAVRQTELRAPVFFEKNRIQLRAGERVSEIDLAGGFVRITPGESVGFDHLILATGARNRQLRIPGAELGHVHYLRTLSDAIRLREAIPAARQVAVIGGGFIGLEVAAACRGYGKPVTVIETQSRLLARVVSPQVGEYFRATHAAEGVQLIFHAAANAIADAGVETSRGFADADLVVIGIGVIPNTELAAEAGLAVGNGITVDQHLRTADPRVFAIGDCAEFPCAYTGTRVRLESVQNCVDQAIAVAKTITGKPAPYIAVPWFWTDQFDLRLQMAGLAPKYDELITRGDPDSRKFSVFYFDGGALKAVDSINRPAEHLAARRLIAASAPITPAQAADEAFDLKAALS